MEAKDFVYLHTHSHYSLLEALPKPKALVKRAKELGMNTLALTDNGAIYGAVEFWKACQDAEIKPIIGADIFVAQHGMLDKRARIDDRPYRLVLLVENHTGYKNLSKILTAGFLEGFYYKPRVDKDFLRKHADGLIALSGSIGGEIATQVLNGDLAKAEELVKTYQSIFGENNFFLELIHHPDMPRQQEVNEAFKKLAKQTGCPLVATKNVFYLNTDDREAYEAQLCIQRGRTLEDFRRTSTDEVDLSFASPQEIMEAFADVPEALSNTRRIADRITFEIQLGKNFLPHFPLPEGKSDNEYLRDLCLEGLKGRYGELTPEIMERFEFEYSTICKMGFSSYFLIVQDFINWAKEHGVLVGPGRGSAAGSIVAYALRITDLNPLQYGLLFERFLNPDRISIPDIDTDFADRGRGKVLEYVTQKYGADRVAGIITFGTLMPRAAVRDAARVLGLSYQEADRIAKVVPPPVQGKHKPLTQAIVDAPDLKAVYDSTPLSRRVIDLAIKLEGNPRHASQHACGIVIGDRPLVDHVPLQRGQHEDMALVTQFSLNSSEAAGLVKMDFLGLSNLTVIEDALEIIAAVAGVKVDMDNLPLDDQKVFALLGRGETTGVFQLESDGMKRYIKELQPTAFEDIIAMVSLYRPGPMQFIESFIRRKHGIEEVLYDHPLMENAFKETYGIPVYQEQVMQLSKDLAGFTGGEADSLRKAMGKKSAELMEKMKAKFIDGAEKNGLKQDMALKIFHKLEDFAAYGFNKSHAACYASIAYRTAYLKAYYPACFMAALMNSDSGNIDRITIEVEECSRMGLKVMPPDVNESFPGFAVVKGTNTLRWGLQAIKNVGTEVAIMLVQERKQNGPFVDLADFLTRIKSHAFNRKTLEALVKSGALDRFGERTTLASNLDELVMYNKQAQTEKERNQSSLFEMSPEMNIQKLELRPAESMPQSLLLSWEKELLGLYVSLHPASLFHDKFGDRVAQVKTIPTRKDDEPVTVAGVITNVKQIFTKKKNEPMAFVRIEDPSGPLETVVFPKLYVKIRDKLLLEAFVVIKGKVSARKREDSDIQEWSVLVDGLISFKDSDTPMVARMLEMGDWQEDIANGPERLPPGVHPTINTAPAQAVNIIVPEKPSHDLIVKLRDVLKATPGATRVYLLVNSGGQDKKIATEYSVTATRDTIGKIAAVVGEANVRY